MTKSEAAKALIGHSGFVGATLSKQLDFTDFYRSGTIETIDGRNFGLVVCSAAPAQKWIANRDPVADRQNIDSLISHLKTVTCNTFVLISTVDVFKSPIGVDEDTPVDEEGLHAYGLHRRLLEKFVQGYFKNHLIVRLPGLVGPGLRKNVIYDFLNDNNLHAIDSRGVFQFYPMVNLWWDIQTALQAGLKLVHLTAEPISVADVSALGFGKPFMQPTTNPPAIYDMRTRHAAAFGGTGHYQYSQRDTLQAVRAYAQSEPKALPAKVETSA
ncbi:MAG: pyridine nucleotide transhydrogenase [Rhodoferax sp.]|uniref:pyridine nucleotide transhydrogenase n=1 Tax=Rhodoferax sp. TaxID=50421 RepID=UPI003BB13156